MAVCCKLFYICIVSALDHSFSPLKIQLNNKLHYKCLIQKYTIQNKHVDQFDQMHHDGHCAGDLRDS